MENCSQICSVPIVLVFHLGNRDQIIYWCKSGIMSVESSQIYVGLIKQSPALQVAPSPWKLKFPKISFKTVSGIETSPESPAKLCGIMLTFYNVYNCFSLLLLWERPTQTKQEASWIYRVKSEIDYKQNVVKGTKKTNRKKTFIRFSVSYLQLYLQQL